MPEAPAHHTSKLAFDRRRTVRHKAELAVKMRREGASRFLAGRTCDLSAGGALVQLMGRPEVVCGQRVDIALSASAHQTLIRSADMTSAVVVRIGEGVNGWQAAVRFDRTEPVDHAVGLPAGSDRDESQHRSAA